MLHKKDSPATFRLRGWKSRQWPTFPLSSIIGCLGLTSEFGMGSGVSPDINSPTKPIAAAKRRVTFKYRSPPFGDERQFFVVHVVVVNLHSPYFEQTSVCSRYILSARSVNIVKTSFDVRPSFNSFNCNLEQQVPFRRNCINSVEARSAWQDLWPLVPLC